MVKAVSCCQRSPLPKLSWAQGYDIPLSAQGGLGTLFGEPSPVVDPPPGPCRAAPAGRASRSLLFLISMLSVVSCGEVQSHPPRPGRGITGWHHLFPEVCAPGPCGHVFSGLDEVELC